MKEEKVTVNFKVSADEREYLKTLAAKARISQSELMSRLIADYGEQLVQLLREPTFTPESGLPGDDDEVEYGEKYANFYRELEAMVEAQPEYRNRYFSALTAEQWLIQKYGVDFEVLYRWFDGDHTKAFAYIDAAVKATLQHPLATNYEQKPTDDAPESGLPESDFNDPYLNFCRELGKLIVSMPEYTGTDISYIAAEQWYMSIGGMNFGKLYRSFNGNLLQAWDYIRD